MVYFFNITKSQIFPHTHTHVSFAVWTLFWSCAGVQRINPIEYCKYSVRARVKVAELLLFRVCWTSSPQPFHDFICHVQRQYPLMLLNFYYSQFSGILVCIFIYAHIHTYRIYIIICARTADLSLNVAIFASPPSSRRARARAIQFPCHLSNNSKSLASSTMLTHFNVIYRGIVHITHIPQKFYLHRSSFSPIYTTDNIIIFKSVTSIFSHAHSVALLCTSFH